MALADKLLDNISEEQFAEYMLVEENPHIVIDEDRNIILPERYKIIAAQGDHDMTTYTFDCPRFSDGRDMSKMVVYINYIRSDGETGSYPADNVSIDAQDNNLMHFEWRPLLPATLEHGAFAFLVCVCRTEPDGNMKNHWSTRLCKDATISEGMDCHKDTIINMYPDVITRILERLNVLEDGGTTSVQYTVQDLEEEQKVQARKNIEAADAKEVSKLSEDIATKASAIKEKASGEVIVVTDSAEAKPLGLAIDGKSEQNQYSGKNFLACSGLVETVSNGVTFTPVYDENGLLKYIELSGTATADCYISIVPNDYTRLKVGTNYIVNGCPSGGDINTYCLQVNYITSDGTKLGIMDKGEGANYITYEERKPEAYIVIKNGYTANKLRFYPMISVEGGEYEPYCGGIPSPNPSYPQEIRNIGVYDEASGKYAVEVKGSRKNWLKTIASNITMNGITFSLNADGSVHVTGKKNGYAGVEGQLVDAKPLIGKTVTIKNDFNCMIVGLKCIYDDGTSGYATWEDGTGKRTCVIPNNVKYICFNGYVTVDTAVNGTLYIQLELGEKTTDYEPYEETTTTVYLDEPLRKEDKVYWNGQKMLVERNRAVTVFDGSEDEGWSTTSTNSEGKYRLSTMFLNGLIKPSLAYNDVSDIVCTILKGTHLNDNYSAKDGIAVNISDGRMFLYTSLFNTSDVSFWKTYLSESPILVEYTLATPITEEIDIDLDGLSMFYPTTILSNDCNANMEVEYIADTKAYIDKKFAELATAMV